MNQKDDDKATAALLLSTDEAVLEKIRRVLTAHPDIVYGIMKRYEEQLMTQQREAEYQRALQQAMLQRERDRQSQWHTYPTDNTGQTIPQWLGDRWK